MHVPSDLALVKGSSKKFEEMELEFVVQSSFIKQVAALATRELTCSLRDTNGLVMRFGATIVLSLVFGLVFLGIGSADNGVIANFDSHVGSISMLMMMAMMGSSQQILVTFPFERPMFLREYTTGTCKSSLYLIMHVVDAVVCCCCR
jgi:hypothetical protein